MNPLNDNAFPKVHPATRLAEPEDPMNLHGFEVPGDPEVMLRMLVEEYARMGFGAEEIMRLFRDPFYQAFHGLYQIWGEEGVARRVGAIISKFGVMRTTAHDRAPAPHQLVELSVPKQRHGRSDDA